MTYTLSEAQKAIWHQQLGEQPRGTQRRLAEALARKVKGKESAWTTQMSNFFKGDDDGLRAIFDHPERLKVVAEGLGLSPRQLRDKLALAQGIPPEDALDEMRVPGFEDLGPRPILEAFYPPAHRETQFHLPRHPAAQQSAKIHMPLLGLETAGVHSSSGGQVNLDELTRAAAVKAPGLAKAIVIIGAPGLGKTPLLRALIARLEANGISCEPWQAGTIEEASTVWVDDLGHMDLGHREALLNEVKQRSATMLATSTEEDSLRDIPEERVTCALRTGDETWATGFLDHLQALLKSAWGRDVKLGVLRDWLQDDPYALWLAGRADTVGFLVRHVTDGGKVPVRHRELLRMALSRWAEALRRQKRGAPALMLELTGHCFLGRAAALACLEGGMTVALNDLARELVSASAGLSGDPAGPWGELGAPGMLGVLEAYLDTGLFWREGGRARPAQDAFFVSALGHELARRLDDDALVRAVLLQAPWHAALVAAAEERGDLAPVLEAIARQPASVRCLAFPALTRALASGVQCTRRDLLGHSFLQALRWWAHWSADSRSTTITFGGGPARPASPRPPEALIGGVAPLVAMGIASRQVAGDLRLSLTVEELLGLDLGADLHAYLALMGHGDLSAEQAQDALLLGAPFQAHAILDPEVWRRLPGREVMGHDLPGGITREEYALWWRTVAVPRFGQEPNADAWICGTVPGTDITHSMAQVHRGSRIWGDALARRVRAEDALAPAAFIEAVAYALEWGGEANARALIDVWAKLGARDRATLREAGRERLRTLPDNWSYKTDLARWLLREYADDALRLAIWETWAASLASPGWHPAREEWRQFLEGGLPEERVVRWALETMPEVPRRTTQGYEPFTNRQGQRVLAAVSPGATAQAAALDHLVEHGSLETLDLLQGAPKEWATKARFRLRKDFPEVWRQRMLEAAPHLSDDERTHILYSIAPRPGEFDLWFDIAEAASNWTERLVRWCQVAVADPDDERRWGLARMGLTMVECVALGPEAGRSAWLELWSSEDGDPPVGDEGDEAQAQSDASAEAKLEAEFASALAELEDLGQTLANIGDALTLAWRLKLPGLRELVADVFASTALRPRVLGGYHQSWWVLAYEFLGQDRVIELLVTGHHDRSEDEATIWRLDAITNGGIFDQVVLPLAHHPILGRSALKVIASRIIATRPDLMLKALEGQPLTTDAGERDNATLSLVRKLAQSAPQEAIRWLEARLPEASPELRRSWWAGVVPVLAPGAERERALSCWMDAA